MHGVAGHVAHSGRALAERGTHAELVAKGGIYEMLVRRQLAASVLQRLGERRSDPSPAFLAGRATLDEPLDRFAELLDQDPSTEDLAEADLAIVAALVSMTGSPVLALCMNPILEVLGGFPKLSAAIYREPGANLAGWQLLLVWLDTPKAPPLDAILGELERRDAATLAGLGLG